MAFDRFEEWERGLDAQAELKKRQNSSSNYGGIEMQYGLPKNSPVLKKKKKTSFSSSNKPPPKKNNNFKEEITFDVEREIDKRSKVERWLNDNDNDFEHCTQEVEQPYVPSKQRKSSSSSTKQSHHRPILIDSNSSVDESQKENKKRKEKELKRENTDDDTDSNEDFLPKSQKKMKPQMNRSEANKTMIKSQDSLRYQKRSQASSNNNQSSIATRFKLSCSNPQDSPISQNKILAYSSYKNHVSLPTKFKKESLSNSQDVSKSQKKIKVPSSSPNNHWPAETKYKESYVVPKHDALRRTISAPEEMIKKINQTKNDQQNLFEVVFPKTEVDEQEYSGVGVIKKEVVSTDDDKPVAPKNTNTQIKQEQKSPPKSAALRPASFICKPRGDACVQTDINSNTLRDLLICAKDLPPVLANETRYKWSVTIDDQHLRKSCRKVKDGKGNDLNCWFTHILDNYRSKRDYKGEDGCNCFITLNSRYKVMSSSTAEVEVLTDGSSEDNWMRNIKDPIRVYNFIDKPFYAQHIGDLSDKLPEILITRIFPDDVT